MSELEYFQDFITASLVIAVISFIITIAWISTRVQEQPLIAAAVVVLQQETNIIYPSNMSSEAEISSTHQQNQSVIDDSQSLDSEMFNIGDVDDSAEVEISESRTVDSVIDDDHLEAIDITPVIDSSHIKPAQKSSSLNAVAEETSDKYKISEGNLNNRSASSLEEGDASSYGEFTGTIESSIRRRVNNSMQHECSVTDGSSSSVSEKGEDKIRKDSSPVNTANGQPEVETSPPDFIRIRLKFLDDTQRLVRGHLSELVGNFKRANFQIELSTNCAVRLIFNGQLLNRDSSTLGQYGLFDNCVVHCYIGQPQSQPSADSASNTNNETEDTDLSEILSPLLLIVVAFLWYLRYEYSHIFNTSATIILACLTALLLVSQYALTITFNISLGFNNPLNRNQQGDNQEDSDSSNRDSNSTSSPPHPSTPPPSLPDSSGEREQNPQGIISLEEDELNSDTLQLHNTSASLNCVHRSMKPVKVSNFQDSCLTKNETSDTTEESSAAENSVKSSRTVSVS